MKKRHFLDVCKLFACKIVTVCTIFYDLNNKLISMEIPFCSSIFFTLKTVKIASFFFPEKKGIQLATI